MKVFAKSIISIALSLVILVTSITAYAENKFGIDVSKNNGDVSFAQSVDEGKSFVMIRLGNYTILDNEFWNNVAKACDAGLEFGVYMYSAAFSVEEAKIEANFVIDTLKQMPQEYKKYFTLPVAYDMEAKGLMNFSKAQLTNQVVTFSDMMIKNGYVPMVYANVDWFTNRLDVKKFKDKGYKIWLARWVSKPNFNSKMQVGSSGVYADVWQYQGGANHSSGLDQNVAYDLNGLKHIYRLTSTVNATCVKSGSKKYTCSACGKIKTVTLKPTGTHSYNSGKVTKKPTSSSTGVMTYTCKTCGKKKTNTIAKLVKTSISKLTAKSKGFTVSWKKVSSATGYQIQYSTSSKFTNAKIVTITKNSTVSKTVSKLSAKKRYYVRVRTYKTINGTKYYSSWSDYKYVTTNK